MKIFPYDQRIGEVRHSLFTPPAQYGKSCHIFGKGLPAMLSEKRDSHTVLVKFTCQKSLQTINYSSGPLQIFVANMREVLCG